MRAPVFENRLPCQATTRILGALTPRAYVGPPAPTTLKEIAAP